MKTETRNKIEEALSAVAQLREEYPLDVSTFTRPDELEVYEIEVLNEGAIYPKRKALICWLINKIVAHMAGAPSVMCVMYEVALTLQDLFNETKHAYARENEAEYEEVPRIGLHAALNHMEQQLQEFLINGLYDELQECFQ